jgi:hypothetical protein
MKAQYRLGGALGEQWRARTGLVGVWWGSGGGEARGGVREGPDRGWGKPNGNTGFLQMPNGKPR